MKTTSEKLCIARAAEVLGDKWTPYLILALSQGVCGFCRLQENAGGVNPRTLSLRLAKLEKLGVVEKNKETGIGYKLTKAGEALVPILVAMSDWGHEYEKAGSKIKVKK
jgi:DNA-binding HxlR family transcriptional regulator